MQVAYQGGRMSTRPLACFEPKGDNAMGSIEERLGQVHFRRLRDIRSILPIVGDILGIRDVWLVETY